MEIVNFEGVTRTLGEKQGYRALHIKDSIMVDENGNKFPSMISVWKPTEEELMTLMYNGYIMITVIGTSHPPISVDILKDG